MAGTLYATLRDYKGKTAVSSIEVAAPTMENAKKLAEFLNANSDACVLAYGITQKDVIASDSATNGPYDRVYQRLQLMFLDVATNESRRFSIHAPDKDGMEEDQEATATLVTAAKTLLSDIGAITSTATYNGSALISKGAKSSERRK